MWPREKGARGEPRPVGVNAFTPGAALEVVCPGPALAPASGP